MKKFFVVALVFAVAVALVAAMGCSNKATGPTDAQKTATAISAEGTAIAGTAVYQEDFETNVGGFAIDTVTNSISDASLSTAKSYYGSQSVALTMKEVAGSQCAYVDKSIFSSPPTNWVGKTITMHVWVPAAVLASAVQYAFEISIQAGSGWNTYNSWILTGIVADKWNTLTFVVPNNADTVAGIDDVGFNIQEVGGCTDMANSAVIYLDGISVN
jgi:hypothetical protein